MRRVGASDSETKTQFGRIAVDDLEPDSYRQIVHAWCAQRGDARFPPIAKIDPFVVPTLAANLLLLEVEGESLIYRILGEKVVTAVGSSLKGKSMREIYGDTDYVRIIEEQLLACAASAIPFYSCHDFHLPDAIHSGTQQHRKAWRIALPYGDGDRVTRLLCYQLFSQEIEISFRENIDLAKLLPRTVFRIEV